MRLHFFFFPFLGLTQRLLVSRWNANGSGSTMPELNERASLPHLTSQSAPSSCFLHFSQATRPFFQTSLAPYRFSVVWRLFSYGGEVEVFIWEGQAPTQFVVSMQKNVFVLSERVASAGWRKEGRLID